MVQWNECFWGEECRGFDLLSSNAKYGAMAIEEFQRFIQESVQSEMVYCRALSRLQSQLLKAQYVGTFTPIWNCIRDLIDGTTTAHLASLSSYQELLQRIGGYQEVFQRKTKNYIQKDNDISRTADLINHLKHARELVVHAKRLYHSQLLDYERVLRNHSNSNSTTDMSSVSGTIPRQVARSAKKLKQLKEEYKVAIEKYNNIRNEYVKVFTEVCNKFQGFEIEHIEQMLSSALAHADIVHKQSEYACQTQSNFYEKIKSFTGSAILDSFVEQKKTGFDHPVIMQFEEMDKTSDKTNGQDKTSQNDRADSTGVANGSELNSDSGDGKTRRKKRLPIKSRRHREKTKKSIEKSQETKIEQNRNQPVLSTVADVENSQSLSLRISTSSSTSSDSTDSDEKQEKIHFKIDSPRLTTDNMTNMDDYVERIRSIRSLDLNQISNTTGSKLTVPITEEKDPTLSSASSVPETISPVSPLSWSNEPNPMATTGNNPLGFFPTEDPFNRLSADFQEKENEQNPTIWFNSTVDNMHSLSNMSIDENENRTSPFPKADAFDRPSSEPSFSRTIPDLFNSNTFDSANPIDHNVTKSSMITATVESEPIPLAIAFQETINVKMAGEDQESYVQTIIGEMSISFPAVMLTLLCSSSENLNQLAFRLKNFDCIENIQLKSIALQCNESDDSIYSFNMEELNRTLVYLYETSSESRFFNMNILAYEMKRNYLRNVPIEISSKWKRSLDWISVTIKYRFTDGGLPSAIELNKGSVIIYTIIDEGEQIQKSIPDAQWSKKERKLWWRIPYARETSGNLTATVLLEEQESTDDEKPWTTSSPVNVYFLGENGLFSSLDFELISDNYRISLLKKKIITGTYQHEPDQNEPMHLFQRSSMIE